MPRLRAIVWRSSLEECSQFGRHYYNIIDTSLTERSRLMIGSSDQSNHIILFSMPENPWTIIVLVQVNSFD